MKAIQIILWFCIFCSGSTSAQAQIKKKVNTGSSININNKVLDRPIPIKKIREQDYKNKLAKDLRASATSTMRVPSSYLSKRSQNRKRITPANAFGSGNLGLTVFSGALFRTYFRIDRDFIGNEPMLYVATIEFDARSGKTYLIRIHGSGAGSQSYIVTYAGGRELKLFGNNRSYLILVEAQETGRMRIPISARFKVGGNDRYPDSYAISEIVIDEI